MVSALCSLQCFDTDWWQKEHPVHKNLHSTNRQRISSLTGGGGGFRRKLAHPVSPGKTAIKRKQLVDSHPEDLAQTGVALKSEAGSIKLECALSQALTFGQTAEVLFPKQMLFCYPQ